MEKMALKHRLVIDILSLIFSLNAKVEVSDGGTNQTNAHLVN